MNDIIVDEVTILLYWDTDRHLVHRLTNTLLPCLPTLPLYMQSIQTGSIMVAEIMYAKW